MVLHCTQGERGGQRGDVYEEEKNECAEKGVVTLRGNL